MLTIISSLDSGSKGKNDINGNMDIINSHSYGIKTGINRKKANK